MTGFHGAKLFRDPVHDTINWKDEGDIGALVCALIDQPEFQRLRFVRQLGLASMVFPGAEHSRFVHSIGVSHIARRMLARIEPNAPDSLRAQVIGAALLHDVGHGPFSHVLERVFNFRHEDLSRQIVQDETSGVHRVLARVDTSLPQQISDMIVGKGPAKYAQIVSSQLDADRFDYLLRDVMMTGVVVGRFDLERLLVLLRADDEGLLVDHRGWEAVEGYLIARYHMYRLVYFHRTVRAAEVMLERLFQRARDVLGPDDPSVEKGGVISQLLCGDEICPRTWLRFTEFHAWAQIDRWRDHSDRVLALLADGLIERKLFKAIERNIVTEEDSKKDLAMLAAIDEGLSPDERSLFAMDEASDATYQPYVASDKGHGHPIRIVDRRGRISLIEQVSPVVHTLGQTATHLRRWYVHPLILDKVIALSGLNS